MPDAGRLPGARRPPADGVGRSHPPDAGPGGNGKPGDLIVPFVHLVRYEAIFEEIDLLEETRPGIVVAEEACLRDLPGGCV